MAFTETPYGSPLTEPLRALYGASIDSFLHTPHDQIIGMLAINAGFSVVETQRNAWLAQIAILESVLTGTCGSIFLEFSIPRMGRRIDAVVLIGPVVFVLEFKVGASTFERAAIDQVWDYALDLKYFHEASKSLPIVPLVVATEATPPVPISLEAGDDQVYRPLRAGKETLRFTIELGLAKISGPVIDAKQWARAPYHPTPTIVEAARALYAQHSVEAIARYDAGAVNLRMTLAPDRRPGE